MDNNPLVREICTEFLYLINQPNSRFQVYFYAIFNEEACAGKNNKRNLCVLIDDAFVNTKTNKKSLQNT